MTETDLIKLQLVTGSVQRVMGVTRDYVESEHLNGCKAAAIWAAYRLADVDVTSIAMYHKLKPLLVENIIHDCSITLMTDDNVKLMLNEIEKDYRIPFKTKIIK